MNIGDKVRVVHGKEEGIIVGFGLKGIIEVMLSDGFRIPFSKSDLVVVSNLEEKVFTKTEESKEVIKTPLRTSFSDKGIFIGKTLENDGTHTFHLINNTDFQLLFTSYLIKPNEDAKALAAAVLQKKTTIQLFYTQQVSLLEESKLLCQILFFANARNEIKLPLVKDTDLRLKFWKGEQDILPVLGRKGFKVQIDHDLAIEEWKSVGNAMTETIQKPVAISLKPPLELDLHIEKLVNDYYTLKPEEMLRYQLRAFESHIEKSISAGLKEVVYIHGIGNGILKAELAKKLSGNIFVKHFEDARKDKYGMGATKVVLK